MVVTPANTHDADAVDDLLADHVDDVDKPIVMGDCAYASADTLDDLEQAGFDVMAKVSPAGGRGGMFGKDDFAVDLDADTVCCPAGHVVTIRRSADSSGRADFAEHCAECPLRSRCTTSASGRSVTIHPKEAILQRAKAAQADPAWRHAYRSTRPKVERKIAHFVRVAWGGRKARTRGRTRVTTDVETRAAAVNWARLVALGITFTNGGWATATS